MAPNHDERAALPPAHGVLLWSMRAWVLGLARSTDMSARIRGAFAGIEAEDAAPGLSGFMQAVEDGGIRAVDVGRMCSHRVTEDERLLLAIFRMVQAGEAAPAARALRGMVASGSVAAALASADDVASALLDAGHLLSRDDAAPRTPRTPQHAALH